MQSNTILLINPWIYDFAAYDFWIKPVGLLSIGNFLEQHGYQTHLIDCLDRFHPRIKNQKNRKFGIGKFIRTEVEKPAGLKHVPRKYCRYGLPVDSVTAELNDLPKPDAILVTSGMTYWYPGVQLAIQLVKEKYPTVPVILGGIYATLFYEHSKNHSGADYVIKGSGEKQALELVDSLTGNQHSEIADSDFPEPTYHYYKKLASLPLFTSFGCPYKCSFCASHLISGKFRQRNPQDVIEEIDHYYHTRHVRNFAFFDDALLINADRHISVILQSILAKKLQVTLHTPNGIHPKQIDQKLAELMFQSGFKTIRLSYETHNIKRQHEMGGKVSDDSLRNAVNYLCKADYSPRDIDVYVIMGLPDQTFQEVLESMLFVAKLGTKVRLTSFSPIPGTLDWQRCVDLFNMPEDIDPILTNNTIYPLNRPDFTFEMFQRFRELEKVLNYSIDHGINFFDGSELAKQVKRFLKNNN